VELSEYRKIFKEIVQGCTKASIDGKTYFIKHLTAHDQVDIDEVNQKYLDEAKARGIPSEKDILKSLESEGQWTKANEKQIEKLEVFIEQLQKNKSALVLKSEIDRQNQSIEETRAKINAIKEKRSSLLGVHAESYASKRANDHYIIKSFFEDELLEHAVFPEEKDYDSLYAEEVQEFVSCYNNTFLSFEEIKIQEMILQDFYYIYFPFSDDTVGFFGKPVCQLTYNQLKLIVYTKIFKNIFETNKHIPEKIKKDPQALLDYGSISDDAKEKMKNKLDKDQDGATLFGATDEDYEYAGLDKPSDRSGISIQKAAEKKGGALSMEDLMELSGIPKN
jgi:hypothetical protein